MKQVFFDGKGGLHMEDVPAPDVPPNGALVRVAASLISSGTETTQAAGGGSLLRKAIEQPELIGRAMQLALREGLRFTMGAVQDVAETWFEAGYSTAGIVVAVGAEGGDCRAGDRVACAGAGFANHAHYNVVPQNLLAPIPDNVTDQEAAFTTVGAIALQGVRRAEVTLGETVVVVGLGLIGQITAQLLDAAGCRVIGSDPVAERRELASRLSGAITIDPTIGDAPGQVMTLTNGIGADKVILCAATASSNPTNEAFAMCRERGRVVMVGAMGMELDRTLMYQRELDFVISRSTGPGRHDRNYEERGVDYPIGYVRWTEQRNMTAFLDLLAVGKLDVDSLVSGAFPVEEAQAAYDNVQSGGLAVLLTYGAPSEAELTVPRRVLRRAGGGLRKGRIGIALVGAGSFARAMHVPNLKDSPYFDITAVVSGSASAAQTAQKINAPLATTDLSAALADPDVGAVLISTRHHFHAAQAIESAEMGCHIFVEKPMALTVADCEDMINAAERSEVLLTVGFNRRMAPTAQSLKASLDAVSGPVNILFRVNAGAIPSTHFLNDPLEGGGRLLGEGVHFIDFVCGMVDADPITVSAQGSADGQDFTISLRFPDDSLGTVIYTALGDPAFPKERIEAYVGGGVAVLDDFKTLMFHGMRGDAVKGSQDKGHRTLLDNFGAAIQGKADLAITAFDGLRATRVARAAMASIRRGETIVLGTWREDETE